jgi:hypothetical protein
MTANSFRFLHGGLVLSLALALVSCGPGRNQFPPACPTPGLVKPLSELTRYRGATQDMRDLVIRAHITNITGKCEPGDNNTVVATAQAVVDLTRGPAMVGDTYDIPLFLAVTDSDAIRDKYLTAMRIEFPRNVDTARFLSEPVRMVLPVSAEKSGAAYGIVAGFQLAPEEVAAWRRNNRR